MRAVWAVAHGNLEEITMSISITATILIFSNNFRSFVALKFVLASVSVANLLYAHKLAGKT